MSLRKKFVGDRAKLTKQMNVFAKINVNVNQIKGVYDV